MINSDEISIRLATKADGLEICKLLKQLGLQLPDDANEMISLWKRIWEQNPYYQIFKEDIVYGWVMEHNRTIVGFFGSIPRVYKLNSNLIPVSVASQWGVKKEFRSFTSLLCDKYFKENSLPLKLVTTAIKPTGRIFERYGGKKIPDAHMGLVYMVPISLLKLVSLKFQSNPAKSILNQLDKIIPWKFQYKLIKKKKQVSEIDIDSPPPDFDTFLNSFCNDTAGLLALRTIEIIKWHSSDHTNKSRKQHFTYSENGKTLGYASTTWEQVKDYPDILRFKLVDIIALSRKAKKLLLKELIRYAYQNNADILEIHHPGMVAKHEIPSFVVLQRKHNHFPLYYQTSDVLLEELLKEPGNWHISPFDGDTSL